MEKRWVYYPANKELQGELAANLRISPILAQMLINRGVRSISSAERFLRPELTDLEDPMLLPDMEKATKRINSAICNAEKIVIYGDYDVDGISGTALMSKCLDMVCANVSYYIPERLEEGYGLNPEAIKRLAKEGANVIITVDCGINSCLEAVIAKQYGIDLIITDHHEPGDLIPDAFAVVNPKLESSQYPFRELSGAGISFKLAWALGQTFSNGKRVSQEFRDFLLSAIGLAALGTIADVVPLHGENRIISKFGLEAIQYTDDLGIRALIRAVNLEDEVLNPNHIGFRLGPRLNAAGRIGNAAIAVELLTTKDGKRANEIAIFLEEKNKKRQKIQADMFELAMEKLRTEVDLTTSPAIILSDDSWHPGVVGVIASKLAEKYFRPAIMFGITNGIAHGSARSIPAFHILKALEIFKERFISLGGHSQAAGIKIYKDELEDFKEAFNKTASSILQVEDLIPILPIDLEIPLFAISKSLIAEVSRLAPYGEGNPQPILSATNLRIAGSPRRVGPGGQHLSFFVREGNTSYKAIAFGSGDKCDSLQKNGGYCALAYMPKINRWMDTENLELEVKDIKIGYIGQK